MSIQPIDTAGSNLWAYANADGSEPRSSPSSSSSVASPQATKQIPGANGDVAAKNGQEKKSSANPLDESALKRATDAANQAVQQIRNTDLSFSVDKGTGTIVVKIEDTKTHQLIKQIPAQEMLELAKRLKEVTGILIKDQA